MKLKLIDDTLMAEVAAEVKAMLHAHRDTLRNRYISECHSIDHTLASMVSGGMPEETEVQTTAIADHLTARDAKLRAAQEARVERQRTRDEAQRRRQYERLRAEFGDES